MMKLSKDEFVKRAEEVHGNKYDYSKVEYVNKHTKICIICHEHGEFWQSPNNHLAGNGCRKCWLKRNLTSKLSNTEVFINKAKQIHGNKYDYSKTIYEHSLKKVCIICPEHGEFWQTPNSHLNGQGCPICNESTLEREVNKILREKGINFIQQFKAKWLGRQSLDFYLPDYNMAIECQGIQHFMPKKYFGGEKSFKTITENDIKKRKLCEENNIKIIYYTKKKFLTEQYYSNNIVCNEAEMLKLLK